MTDVHSDTASVNTTRAAESGERSTAHYVLVVVTIFLLLQLVTFTAIMFTNALHYMSPPFGPAELPWVVTVTFLVGSALMPLAGKLADAYGFRKLYMTVIALFLIGSLLGAVTSSYAALITARVLQAPVMALTGVHFAFLRSHLPARMVPVAVGVSTSGTGLALLIGPTVSGALLGAFGYRSVFWLCLIYMAVLAPLLWSILPAAEQRVRRSVDVPGSLLLTLSLGLLLLGVSQGGSAGWSSYRAWLPLAVTALAAAAFVAVESRVREPAIDLNMLVGPRLRTSLLVGFFGSVPFAASGYLIPQMVESTRLPGTHYGLGFSAFQAGLTVMSTGVGALVCAPLGGFLCQHRSPRLVVLLSGATGIAASLFLALAHGHLWEYVIAGLLFGVSMGFYFPGTINLVIEAVPAELTGVAGGLQSVNSAFTSGAAPVVATLVLGLNVLGSTTPEGRTVYADAGYRYLGLGMAAAAAVAFVGSLRMRHGREPAAGGQAALSTESEQ
ncbi:MFS transporter [Streptomyces sp. NPDC048254]|uniref:MFS transporter n=1 Tax=Streptomyces sp. NPDC048254 TaxID=3365525 RepID=UPI0037126A53